MDLQNNAQAAAVEAVAAEADEISLLDLLIVLAKNMATGKIPEAGLEYLRRFRDVKYHETIFELMAKQFEIARIDESREGAVIQVVDPAQPPERKFKPKRALIVLMSTLAAFFVAVLWVFVRQALNNSESDPYRARRLAELKVALAWKRHS